MTNNIEQRRKPGQTTLKPEEVKTCDICGGPYVGWGNNAAPFPGRCCNECNTEFVIPARMKRMLNSRGW